MTEKDALTKQARAARVKLAKLIQEQCALIDDRRAPNPDLGRYLALSRTSLQLGRMWLGKLLKAVTGESPYTESRNPLSPVIENSTDTYDGALLWPAEDSLLIPFFKRHRKELDELLTEISTYFVAGGNENAAVLFATQHLVEADMWLGQALGTMRDKTEPAS